MSIYDEVTQKLKNWWNAESTEQWVQDEFNIDTPNTIPRDLTLGQSEYDFTSRVFPSNIGENSEQGHYMIININVPNRSTYDSINNQRMFSRFGPGGEQLSKTDVLRFNMDPLYFDKNGTSQGGANKFSAPRQTRRIKESIVLYIPDTMQFNQSNIYEDVSLTAIAGDIGKMGILTTSSLLSGFAGSFSSTLASGVEGLGNIFSTLAGAAAEGGSLNNNLLQKGLGLTGRPVNPKIEVLFKNTPQREFDFMFLFAPENEKDSLAMQQIIKTLRFHAAPEIDAKSYGFTLTPPSELDITFFDKGVENTNIPRINTCVIENISVDYAPGGSGWQTFSNGHPVMARLTIKLRETEVLSKLRVAQGF